MTDFAEKWMIYTLVDITNTDVYRGNSKERNQQRNFETVMQTVGMLAQPWIIHKPYYAQPVKNAETAEDKLMNFYYEDYIKHFGERHQFSDQTIRRAMIWSMIIGVESHGVFGKDGEVLLKMFDNIPVITGLDEKVKIDPPVFKTTGDSSNLCILQL